MTDAISLGCPTRPMGVVSINFFQVLPSMLSRGISVSIRPGQITLSRMLCWAQASAQERTNAMMAAFDHFVFDGIDYVEGAVQVDIHRALPNFPRHIVCRLDGCHAGAMHEDIDRAELITRNLHNLSDVFSRRHITFRQSGCATGRANFVKNKSRCVRLRTIIDRHVGAVASQLFRYSSPNST